MSDWRSQALCRTVPDFLRMHPIPAVRVCMRCPVVQACLEAALAEERAEGRVDANSLATVRGGLTKYQRHAMHRARAALLERNAA